MYATELNLINFKRFQSQSINLNSNITLLLGPNSSGKSSVIKALLGLKQTASVLNEHEVFSAQGEYVDLGVYKDYVINHDIKKKIKIGLTIRESLSLFPSKSNIRNLYVEFGFGHDTTTEQARLLDLSIRNESKNGDLLLNLIKKKLAIRIYFYYLKLFQLRLRRALYPPMKQNMEYLRNNGKKEYPHQLVIDTNLLWMKSLTIKNQTILFSKESPF